MGETLKNDFVISSAAHSEQLCHVTLTLGGGLIHCYTLKHVEMSKHNRYDVDVSSRLQCGKP